MGDDNLYGGEYYDYEDKYWIEKDIEKMIIEKEIERRLRYAD